jgi:hypothetical protein
MVRALQNDRPPSGLDRERKVRLGQDREGQRRPKPESFEQVQHSRDSLATLL